MYCCLLYNLDQHVQKYFKSPPKSPIQSLHRRQGLGKVNRPVQQLASSYLAAANPNLSKRRDKVRFFSQNQNHWGTYITRLNFVIRIIEHLAMIVVISPTLQLKVLNRAAIYLKVGQYQIIKMPFLIQSSECRVRTH